jgi:hypothetical protein
MIHWAEKRAMGAKCHGSCLPRSCAIRGITAHVPHTSDVGRCGVMSRILKEARLPPPDSVHGVLPLSDVKASGPQQAGCCIVISQPLIQLISSRAEADRWFLIASCCESSQHLFQSGLVSSRHLLSG